MLNAKNFNIIFSTFLCLIISKSSFAEGELLQSHIQTLKFNMDYGFSTSKSKAVESNDTGSTLRYGLDINAGQDLALGVTLLTETASYNYELNNSSMATSFQDLIFSYTLYWLKFGLVFSNATLLAKKENVELSELSGSGYGALMNFYWPLNKKSLLYLNTLFTSTSKAEDKVAEKASIAARMNIDFGASIDLSREVWKLNFGYRQHSFGLALDGENYDELSTSTYLGIAAGITF